MEKQFHFTPPFLNSLKETLNIMSEKLDILNNAPKNLVDAYGVYHCSYKFRFITPSDISTYISNVHKGMINNLIGSNPHDVEMFSSESVKRFMCQNDCPSFCDTDIMGNRFEGKKFMTLQDMLLVHSNTVYDNVVCSPYEQKIRFDDIKKDVDIMNGMHFVANVKKMVDNFPDIVSKMDNAEYYHAQPLVGKLFRAMVEEFIIFAATINMITVSDMVNFVVPTSTFKTTYDIPMDEFTESAVVTESVDTKQNSLVMLCFSQGKSPIISNAIKKATKSPFSHISIGFDTKLDPMYSFGGSIKYDTYSSETKGVRKEDIKGKHYTGIDVDVYGAYLPKDNVDRMKSICDDFVKNADKTDFDYSLLLKKLIRKDGSLPKDEYRQICSTFVNYLLKQVDVNVTDKNIPSPAELKDITDIRPNEFVKIYSGQAMDYNPSDANKQMKQFANRKDSKPITEYVTECCMLKTNSMNINKRLPFNCNLRNVVLNDTTPNFKDTRDAIRFVLNDSRSPIHELLISNASVGRGRFDTDMVKQGFLQHTKPEDRFFNRESNDGFRDRFETETGWFDKIVYGDPYMDSNYRRDNPGNQNTHPIAFDMSVIYKMFCCHHNDNEHIANNIVRVANVMVGLIEDYSVKRDVVYNNLRDILAVFGEILTKDILALYHNNNRVLVCTDDMNDTMIPGYMYVEQFVMEADENKTDADANKKPTVKNATEGLNQSSKGQQLIQKIKQILQRFAEYIRQTLQQIFPKFFEAHKAEIQWIKAHKELNDNIAKALSNGPFKIEISDYPNFKVPGGELIDGPKKAADEAINVINNMDNKDNSDAAKKAETYLNDPNTLRDELLYSGKNEGLVGVREYCEGKNPSPQDIQKATRNFILYSNANGPDNAGEETHVLTPDDWKNIIDDLGGGDKEGGAFKVIEENTKSVTESLTKLTDLLKKKADSAKTEQKASGNDDQNDKGADTSNAAQLTRLFEAVNGVTKNCYAAGLQVLMRDFYGKSYNMYRDIVNEYQRQQKVGVTKPENASETQNNEKSEEGGKQ